MTEYVEDKNISYISNEEFLLLKDLIEIAYKDDPVQTEYIIYKLSRTLSGGNVLRDYISDIRST